jgi:hypothetical protein
MRQYAGAWNTSFGEDVTKPRRTVLWIVAICGAMMAAGSVAVIAQDRRPAPAPPPKEKPKERDPLHHPPAEEAKDKDNVPTDTVAVEIPAAVKKTAIQEIGQGGKIVGVKTEEDPDDGNLYVIDAIVGGADYRMRIAPTGLLVTDERRDEEPPAQPVAAGDVPAAVKAALSRAAGAAAATASDITRQDRQAVYQFKVKLHGHDYTIRLDGDGTLLSKVLEGDIEEDGKTSA